jgi:hypothetical protein
MMPLTAATHIIDWSDTHRAGADLARKNDRVLIRRQCNLELIAGNKLSKLVVRCGNNAVVSVDAFGAEADKSGQIGSFPPENGSR